MAAQKASIMPSTEKHKISFDAGAKAHLDVVGSLPDLNSVSDDHQVTDVCMFFGAAAYYAQFFEASLADFLVTYRRLVEKVHLKTEVETLEELLHKKTMGALLHELRKVFTIEDTEIDSLLSDALKMRNFLMHEFFRLREPDFPSDLKRKRIFEELIQIGLTLKKAMFAIRGMNEGIKRYLQADGASCP
jgi:hypothetical protein